MNNLLCLVRLSFFLQNSDVIFGPSLVPDSIFKLVNVFFKN